MKKTNKVNPLEFFRKSAEARQKAFKTGGTNVPTQSLKKAGDGDIVKNNILKGVFGQQKPNIDENTKKYLDVKYPSTKIYPLSEGKGPRMNPPENWGYDVSNENARKEEARVRQLVENSGQSFNTSPDAFQNELNLLQKRNEKSWSNNAKLDQLESNKIRLNNVEKGYPNYKKGGTHKMPNGKVMLNSKMKKGGVIKSKKK